MAMLDQPPPQADVGHAAPSLEARVDVRDRGQPLATELAQEERPVLVRLGLAPVLTVCRPGHSAAAAERIEDLGQRRAVAAIMRANGAM